MVFLLQVRALLDQVSEKLATFSEVGISPAHDEHILCELTTYEERVCVSQTQPLTNKALSTHGMNNVCIRWIYYILYSVCLYNKSPFQYLICLMIKLI